MPQQIHVNHVLHAIMIVFNLYYMVETPQRNISAQLTWMGVHHVHTQMVLKKHYKALLLLVLVLGLFTKCYYYWQ